MIKVLFKGGKQEKVEQFTLTCEYLKMDKSGAMVNNT